jgi:hypothetical protein
MREEMPINSRSVTVQLSAGYGLQIGIIEPLFLSEMIFIVLGEIKYRRTCERAI